MHTQSLSGPWQFRQVGTDEWLPAQVPGGVHTDLMALGRIPDPFVKDNEKRVQWVAESDWEYRRTFTPDPALLAEEHVYLACAGLDTLAEVYLNGHLLGQTDNMFRRYEWEVKSQLRPAENELLIIFRSPVKYITARQAERPMYGVSQAIAGGPYLRKAPCQFGWDWGPQLPPMGIWKGINLQGHSLARLADVHLRQQHAEGDVTIEARVAIERWQEAPLTATMAITAPDGATFADSAEIREGRETVLRCRIVNPQLWWPNGYGDQPLYTAAITLSKAGAASTETGELDRLVYRLGLRTLELRQEQDEWGRSFQFVVNSVPIFAKGSNWIPADSFPTRISDHHLEHLIRSAAETHQNMLRVWGGGFYEEDRFYDLCDRYGILVWQDMIFSCSTYPMEEPAFLHNVEQEIRQNVRRLRHHASLALWCGNNEMEWGWANWGWNQPQLQDMKAAYDRFFHQLLPAWIAEEDPDRPYWPSSPSSGTPFQNPNGQEQGDSHYWDVWHGRKPFTAYRQQYPRFMSEFGFQSLPPLETIRTYADEADWNMTSYIMEHHQRHSSGNGLIIAQMADTFRLPKDFSSLVYLSMVLQAEGIRYGVEHWRRHMQRVAGTLYWQLNDCWPVASWSSLDYYGRWKALHYAARRFYAPLLLSVEDAGTTMSVHVSSDLRTAWDGTVAWSLETLAGEVLAKGEEPVHVPPLTSILVRTFDFADQVVADRIPGLLGGNRRNLIFVAELQHGNRVLARQVATFVPSKHLELHNPGLKVDVRRERDRLAFEISTGELARFVELRLEGADVIFSDNYFDLPAGRKVIVTCPLPPGWTVQKARAALRVRSLYDSFA